MYSFTYLYIVAKVIYLGTVYYAYIQSRIDQKGGRRGGGPPPHKGRSRHPASASRVVATLTGEHRRPSANPYLQRRGMIAKTSPAEEHILADKRGIMPRTC